MKKLKFVQLTTDEQPSHYVLFKILDDFGMPCGQIQRHSGNHFAKMRGPIMDAHELRQIANKLDELNKSS